MTQQTEKKITIQPLSDRVLVKRIENEKTLKGGIILPDTAKKKQEMAKVIAVGPGKTTSEGRAITCPVKVGAIVLVDKYAGQDVSVGEEEFVILRFDDMIAMIEE